MAPKNPAPENDGVEITENAILGGRVSFRQPAAGYRAAIDPVLLAASIPACRGETVLDVGCGAGAAGLCLAARVPGVRVCGIDLQADLVRLAVRNVQANDMIGRVDFMRGDLLTPPPRFAAGSFHHVMANPPYELAGAGNVSPDLGKAVASVEGEARLRDWLKFCLRMVRPKGTVTLIHRADRLDDLLSVMGEGLGGLAVFALWPSGSVGGRKPKPAKRVLVRGRKGVSAPLRLLPGLILHGKDGDFTPEAEAILRHAEELPF